MRHIYSYGEDCSPDYVARCTAEERFIDEDIPGGDMRRAEDDLSDEEYERYREECYDNLRD